MKPILLDTPDQFETERLLARIAQPGEGAILYDAIQESLDELRPWTFVAQRAPTCDNAEALCRLDQASFLARESFHFHIWRKEDGAFVGSFGLRPFDWNIPSFEIGYWVRTSMGGNGYATEATRGLAEYAFTHLRARRLEIFCDPRNTRSASVAEHAGFHLEGRMEQSWRGPLGNLADSLMYVRLAAGERDTHPREITPHPTYPILLDLPEQLESERLLLRPPRAGDGPMVFDAVQESREHLRPWMDWAAQDQTIEDSEAVALEMRANFARREALSYRLLRRSDAKFVGMCALFSFDWHVPRCEIGYWVRASLQGEGYMTEAVRRLTNFAFDDLGMVRVEIRCDARNIRSAAVAERAGYTLEARLRQQRRAPDGTLGDTLIYASVREET